MIVICIVVVATGHNGFMQPPHAQPEVQQVREN